MKKIIIALLTVLVILLVGCTKEPALGGDRDEHGCIGSAGYSWCEAKQKCLRSWEENCTEEQQLVGNDRDVHGCIGSAGYSWCEAKQKCLRSWEETCSEETNDNKVHVCTEQESQAKACTMDYNPVCGKIVLNMGKILYQTFANGCSACAAMKVVSYIPGECTADKTTDMCSDTKGDYMTLKEAESIAKSSECGDNLIIDCICPEGYRKDGDSCNPNCYYSTPRCLAPSIQCEKTYICNEGTGTFWINLNLTKKGCSPACVIDVESNKAEINWRCTGLVNN